MVLHRFTLPALAAFLCLMPGSAGAHVSEQGFVLLLPTEHYIASGVVSVIASIALISLTPKSVVIRLFTPAAVPLPPPPAWAAGVASLASLAVFAAVAAIGITGPRDPLVNLAPLTVWTGFWIVFFAVVGLAGNLWRYLNPWTGLHDLLFGRGWQGLARMPAWTGHWPALAQFAMFSAFYIADPAPADPDRIAVVMLSYWAFTFAAMALFGGTVWMERGEAFSVLFGLLSKVSVLGDWTKPHIGFPGWALVTDRPLATGIGAFAIAALGLGSFDGLKETFWWLARIGVNPLEFPGRSAVVGSTLAGMALATAALFTVFLAAVWAGGALAGKGGAPGHGPGLGELFRRFAPTLVPIALGYHISHFLIAFLIDGQYLLAAIGDPLANGSDFLGLGGILVTVGFLGTPASVKAIWLSQATIVVAGHIVSVLVSHGIAMRVFGSPRRAALSQIPIGSFMVLYTLFGLWLLASPRGM